MIRLSVLLVLVTAVSACGDSTDPQEQVTENEAGTNVTYDPSTCKTDAEGMVYFALGREVFRRAAVEGMLIRGMSEEERAALSPRPNPADAEGCPDNPIWGSKLGISYQHQPANLQMKIS